MMEQMALPFSDGGRETPAPRPAEPAVWIARFLILRTKSAAEDAVIRDIRLRRGLNILWAPPSSAAEENRLFEGRITGHTAGKTTFCRLVRYLLGEERFGSPRAQDRIRAVLPDGWVVGEIIVGGEPWVVGRPFARGVHPFAARGASLDAGEAALEAREGYQDFLAALTAAAVSPLPVKTLPYARRPVEWPLMLTWLARDQEARFAGIVDFRHPSSESASPSPKVADRHVFLRAALGLMSDDEAALQQAHEALKERKRQLEEEGVVLRRRAEEDRRRLAKRLGESPDAGEAGPLFASQLRERVLSDRAALEREESALSDRRAAVDLALEAMTRAACERALREARLHEIEAELADRRAIAAALLEAKDTVAAASLLTAGDARRGRCSVPLAMAIERGCPLATPALAEPVIRQGERSRDLEAQILRDFEARAADARRALEEADASHRERHAEHAQKSAELLEERARLGRRQAALEETARLDGYAGDSRGDAIANAEAREDLAAKADDLSKRKSARKREHEQALERLSTRFSEVVQALLGSRVRGLVGVSGGELVLQILEHGERDGAAMETLKVLAFDLATLSLRIEGHGHVPGFLIHDGPREADMDEHIYERLFLFAEDLERAPRGATPQGPREAAFQYIVTTTAAPPSRLREAPWLLQPLLDASIPERRLLGMNL
jgi:hypothetical protein